MLNLRLLILNNIKYIWIQSFDCIISSSVLLFPASNLNLVIYSLSFLVQCYFYSLTTWYIEMTRILTNNHSNELFNCFSLEPCMILMMCNETQHQYPTFSVWEPSVLSLNKTMRDSYHWQRTSPRTCLYHQYQGQAGQNG